MARRLAQNTQNVEKLGGPSLWGERLGPGDTRLGESVSRVGHEDQQLNNKCCDSEYIPDIAKIIRFYLAG
ncbi:MAG: hypothetical protein RJA66_1080 [Actinomycetota bacterium]|jgi:hypothetical protein